MGTVELKANEWKDFAANHEYAVIDCSGDNCVACLMLEPVYNAVADTLPGIAFGHINITQHPEIAEQYGINAMPTLLYFRRGEKVYESGGSMEREALLKLVGTAIDAGSAAAVNGKLLQIAGGAVYDEDHVAHELHTEKLDVLEDVLEEAAGEPVLVAYRYQHERDRIMARFPQAVQLKDRETIAAWNRGEIPLLLVHPAGAGHGLNLQDGGHIIVWFGPIYDLELWEQTRDRLYRQGQRSTTSMITLVVEGTVEEDAMRSLAVKDDGQTAMMEAIKARIKKLEDGVA